MLDFRTPYVGAMPFTATADVLLKASSKTLSERIKLVIGISTEVVVHKPGAVEQSQGKARRMIDNRPKDQFGAA